jgi:hypothetical protein
MVPRGKKKINRKEGVVENDKHIPQMSGEDGKETPNKFDNKIKTCQRETTFSVVSIVRVAKEEPTTDWPARWISDTFQAGSRTRRAIFVPRCTMALRAIDWLARAFVAAYGMMSAPLWQRDRRIPCPSYLLHHKATFHYREVGRQTRRFNEFCKKDFIGSETSALA